MAVGAGHLWPAYGGGEPQRACRALRHFQRLLVAVRLEEALMATTLADDLKPLHHPKTWVGKYVWSQDHKVIAIQYSLTAIAIGLVALVLSILMRLQLGFPETFSFIQPDNYLQYVTMHGMIMVVYLLTALL